MCARGDLDISPVPMETEESLDHDLMADDLGWSRPMDLSIHILTQVASGSRRGEGLYIPESGASLRDRQTSQPPHPHPTPLCLTLNVSSRASCRQSLAVTVRDGRNCSPAEK